MVFKQFNQLRHTCIFWLKLRNMKLNKKYVHSSFYFVTFIKTYSKVLWDTFQSLIEFLSAYSYNPKASGDSSIFTIFNMESKSSIPIIRFPPLLSTSTAEGNSLLIV